MNSLGEPQQDSPVDGHYCCLWFGGGRKVKVVLGDWELSCTLHKVANRFFPAKETIEKQAGGRITSITLSGAPFMSPQNAENAQKLRQFTLEVLKTMYAAGWSYVTSSRMWSNCKVTCWFFRKGPACQSTGQVSPGSDLLRSAEFVAVSLSGSNALAVASTLGPAHRSSVLDVVQRATVPAGYEPTEVVRSAFESKIELTECPWNTSGGGVELRGRILILHTVAQLEDIGYELVGTGNFKDKADTLYFIKYGGGGASAPCVATPAFRNPFVPGNADRKRVPRPRLTVSPDSNESLAFNYVMLTLDDSNEVRLVNATASIVGEVAAICKRWKTGVIAFGARKLPVAEHACSEEKSNLQRIASLHNFHCFSLGGDPWSSNGETGMCGRALLAGLLQMFDALGFVLLPTMMLSRKQSDKSVFIFKPPKESVAVNRSDPLTTRVGKKAGMCKGGRPHFVASLHKPNRVRLYPHPSPESELFLRLFHKANLLTGHKATSLAAETDDRGWCELQVMAEKLWGDRGSCGQFMSESAGAGRILMTAFLSMIETEGWIVAASVGLVGAGNADTWFLRRQKSGPAHGSSGRRGAGSHHPGPTSPPTPPTSQTGVVGLASPPTTPPGEAPPLPATVAVAPADGGFLRCLEGSGGSPEDFCAPQPAVPPLGQPSSSQVFSKPYDDLMSSQPHNATTAGGHRPEPSAPPDTAHLEQTCSCSAAAAGRDQILNAPPSYEDAMNAHKG